MLDRRDRLLTLAGILLMGLMLWLMNRYMSDYYLRIVNLIGINIILVASLNLTNGFTGIFSLGHAGFMAVGAYTAALLSIPVAQKAILLPDLPIWLANVHLPFWLAILVGGLMAVFCAIIIGFPVLRFARSLPGRIYSGFPGYRKGIVNQPGRFHQGRSRHQRIARLYQQLVGFWYSCYYPVCSVEIYPFQLWPGHNGHTR
jgi:hypothetical protein